MKALTIAGNIGKSAELRTTQNGDKVAGFTVAVSEGFGDKQRTLWFDVSVWGARAEKLAPMLTKGGKVCVSGDFSTRDHEGKTYLTLRAAEVTLMSPKQDGEPRTEPRQEQRQQRPEPSRADLDDEIPF
jgi:single-strand DNA-binding protein